MINIQNLIKEVYGVDSLPPKPALTYLYRRFGAGLYQGDGHEWEVCRYKLPSAMKDVWVEFLVIGSRARPIACRITGVAAQEIEDMYRQDARKPATEWLIRCCQWAEVQGTPMIADVFAEHDLYIQQAKEWSAAQGMDLAAIDPEKWDEVCFAPFSKYKEEHNDRIRDAYEQIEPLPETVITEFMSSVHTAVADVLRDTLRPVGRINILGEVEVDVVANATPIAVNDAMDRIFSDPHLLTDVMEFVRDAGQGDMAAGIEILLVLLLQMKDAQASPDVPELEPP